MKKDEVVAPFPSATLGNTKRLSFERMLLTWHLMGYNNNYYFLKKDKHTTHSINGKENEREKKKKLNFYYNHQDHLLPTTNKQNLLSGRYRKWKN